MKHLIIISSCSLLLFLTGCATGLKFTTSPAPQPGKAVIYVYRKSSSLGVIGYSKIYANDDFLAALRSGGYATREIPQGTLVFSTIPRATLIPGDLLFGALTDLQKKKYEKIRMQVEAGKTYYFKWAVGDTMKLVDETTGTKEIARLHLTTAADN